MNMYARQNERCLCAAAQSFRSRNSSRKKVNIGKKKKQRIALISFSAAYCTIEYIFSMFYKIGEKKHFFMSDVSGECTMQSRYNWSFWHSNY